MVRLVCGHNGSGKTGKMIQMANHDLENAQGKIVFIEANNKHIYDLGYNIRYINTKEYGIKDEEQFHGFVCGMLATDYDIETVYIDGLYKITESCDDKVKQIIDRLEYLSEKCDVKFIMSMNYEDGQVPDYLKDKLC